MYITKPIYLITLLIFTLILVGINSNLLNRKYSDFMVSLVSAIIAYLYLLICVYIYDDYLFKKLNEFDLNGDGIFSDEEINSEQEAAFNAVIWDTGRSLSPFTGAIFSLGYFITVYLILRILDIATRILRKRN